MASRTIHLNYDVLVAIYSHLTDRNDLLAFMSTCHALRLAGVYYLLRFRVVVTSDKQLASLCHFLLADAPTRLGMLTQLAVRTCAQSPETVNLYLRVLQGARQLRDLDILCGRPASDARIHAAISNLNNVQTLTVHDLSAPESALLRYMDSPVRDIDISLSAYSQPIDPVALLSNFSDSLERLRVIQGYQQRASPKVTYPFLHTLIAESCAFERIEPLIDAFPNLRDLTIKTYGDDETVDEVALDRLRNLEIQRLKSWDTLDRVRGDVLMLYRLGISCRVKRLDIPCLVNTSADPIFTLSFKQMFAAVLADTQPSILTLTLRPSVFDMTQFPMYMGSVPESLQKLVITLHIRASMDVGRVMVSLHFARVLVIRIYLD